MAQAGNESRKSQEEDEHLGNAGRTAGATGLARFGGQREQWVLLAVIKACDLEHWCSTVRCTVHTQEEVPQPDVAMRDANIMDVENPADELLEEEARKLLAERSVLAQCALQCTVRCVLLHNAEVVL